MFSRLKILFLVSLLCVALLNSIPTYLLNFEFFIVIVLFYPLIGIYTHWYIVTSYTRTIHVCLYLVHTIYDDNMLLLIAKVIRDTG